MGLLATRAERVASLMESSSVDEADLAEVLELPDGVPVGDVLNGSYALSAGDLVAVADLLDVPVGVLTGDQPVDGRLGVSLRMGLVLEADVPVGALRHADMLLRHRAVLDSWLGPLPGPPEDLRMSTERYHPKAGAVSGDRVRRVLGLGDEPVEDLIGLVEGLGVPVVFKALPEGLHGLNLRDERDGLPVRVVVVSSADGWARQRFTLAHELCHALYDDAGQVIVDRVDVPQDYPEIRAEAFGRALLLPPRPLKREVSQARRAGTGLAEIVARLVARWGVSRDAVARALLNDGLATQQELAPVKRTRVSELMANAGLAEHWRAVCADEHDEAGSPVLVRRAVEAYGNGWVSARVVAELLGETLESTERMLTEQGWMPEPAPDVTG